MRNSDSLFVACAGQQPHRDRCSWRWTQHDKNREI